MLVNLSIAANSFRPGFTQGAWASGEPVKGLNLSEPVLPGPGKTVYPRPTNQSRQCRFTIPTCCMFAARLMRVHKAPYRRAFTPYIAGMSGGCRWYRRSSPF